MNQAIRPRRLFVSGGSRLSENAAKLWRELGRLLAREEGLVVFTGGLAGRANDPEMRTADRMIVEGMLPVLREQGVPIEDRIETILPDAKQDWDQLTRFKEGKIRVLERRNPQSRRFSMVHSADVVITIAGEKGTQSVLDVALAIERPVLPLPFAGGASSATWKEHREEIVKWFQIEAAEQSTFDQTKVDDLDEGRIAELAGRVKACLLRGFTQGCFVIMRFHEESDPVFDEAIQPALAARGYYAWRTDRMVATGDVLDAIRDGIRHCHFAIADTTGDRPNVMYELGFAHAIQKPVILLRRKDPDGSLPKVPFDFNTHHILSYTDDRTELRKQLEVAIGVISGKSHRPAAGI